MTKNHINRETVLGQLLDGRYWLIKKCTSGGFGETYLAEDTHRPGNPVCFVKHVKLASNNQEFLSEVRWIFNTEAETLEKLGQHDRIPRLLASFEQEEKFYLVQDFVAGHTLSEELTKGDRWQESQVIQLLQEVLPILEFIHSHKVIHRDLKPSNLIRRREDNKLVIVDFGAVKLLSNRLEGRKNSSKSEITVGTPGYMPYEQAQGKPRFNSDLYALGAIAIQALTGTKPCYLDFDPATHEIIWEHLVSISPELTSILNKMVRHNYKERYQSASEVLEALEGLRFSLPAKKRTKLSQSSNLPKKLLLPMGIAISIATTWPIALGVYYLLWHLNIANLVQNLPVFLPFQNQEIESSQ